MKLLNRTILYLSGFLLLAISIWSVIFYLNIIDEIKDSIDDGLEDKKERIIYEVRHGGEDMLSVKDLSKRFFSIEKIEGDYDTKDRYLDTLVDLEDIEKEGIEYELEAVRMLVSQFKYKEQGYKLVVVNLMVEEDDLMEAAFWDIVWLYLVLMACIIIIDNLVLRKLWKPFYSFLEQLKNFKLGHSVFPKAKTKTREFQDLQKAMNILLRHSTEAYEQQKQFIGNASHEMQTPLAVTTNKLELLIEEGELKPHQAEHIAAVMGVIGQLVKLNKSLLLLTKIENKQFLNNQQVFVNEILRECKDNLQEIAAYKRVDITIDNQDELSVQMDISLTRILISNLIRNAIFYNIPDGKVEVKIEKNILRICNTGAGKALDAEKIFDRFYKSEQSQKGTGLGLSIVQAICKLYNFSLSYSFEDKLHCFALEFNQN